QTARFATTLCFSSRIHIATYGRWYSETFNRGISTDRSRLSARLAIVGTTVNVAAKTAVIQGRGMAEVLRKKVAQFSISMNTNRVRGLPANESTGWPAALGSQAPGIPAAKSCGA